MTFLSRFFAFFKKFFESKFSYKKGYYLEEPKEPQNVIDVEFTEVEEPEKDKLPASRRSLLTLFYLLKQEIEIFRFDFPEKYKHFLAEIEAFERDYEKSVEESKKHLTLFVDPEEDKMKRARVELLQDEIENFISGEVRAHTALKKIQILIGKSNILYNTSILHARDQGVL